MKNNEKVMPDCTVVKDRIFTDNSRDWSWLNAFLAYRLPIIAGPCGLESKVDAQSTMSHALEKGIIALRACNDKPRTKPGNFEGMKEEAIPWMVEMTRRQFIVCFEALDTSLTRTTLAAIFENTPSAKVIVWTGARMPGLHARNVANVVNELGCSHNVAIMVKNPMYKSSDAWEGATQFVVDGGADPRQLLLCHRGFFPAEADESPLRNPPDLELTIGLLEKTGLRLVFDPSHTAGAAPLTETLFAMASNIPKVAAQMVEVRPGTQPAQSDNDQQLSWEKFGKLLQRTYMSKVKRETGREGI